MLSKATITVLLGLLVFTVATTKHDVSLASSRSISPKTLQRAFLCIYRYENDDHGWTANTGNGYYGGLQMDREFMGDYGREYLKMWGTADNWPSSVQLAVAYKAYYTRGFYPWPNTAKKCGLL